MSAAAGPDRGSRTPVLLPALVALITSPTWRLRLQRAGRGSGCSDLPVSPVPCLPQGGFTAASLPGMRPASSPCILPSLAGEQNKPAARQDPATSPRHAHPTELGSALALRQLPGSPAGIWGAAAWPTLPTEPVPFLQKEESGCRFNLESLKSQTRCRHRQVGTGRGGGTAPGASGHPHGGPSALEGWCRLSQPCFPPTQPRHPALLCPGWDAAPLTLLLPPRLALGTGTAWQLSSGCCVVPLPCACPKGLDGFPCSRGNPTEEKAPSSPLHLHASPGA